MVGDAATVGRAQLGRTALVNNKLSLDFPFNLLFLLCSIYSGSTQKIILPSTLQFSPELCIQEILFDIEISPCLSKSPLFVPLAPLPVASSPSSLSGPSNTPQEPTCHTAMRQAVPSTVPSPAITAQKLQIAAASSTQADSCYKHNSGTPALQSGLMIPGLCTVSGMLLSLASN